MLITIDGNLINNKQELHQFIKQELKLDDSYGMNLDALEDILYNYQDLEFKFINASKLITNLEGYFFKLLLVLKDNDVNVSYKVD